MKNLLLSLSALLICSSAFAQLRVTPNGTTSTDSYIYVSDEVLFVEGEIFLTENTNDPTTVASIYLRDEAQLIQGTTASDNRGSGSISIFQESNSDSYDYNYWCSPVGVPAGGPGNMAFGTSRLFDQVSDTESTLALTTSGFNGTASPLRISRRWLYRWNPNSQRWLWNSTNDIVGAGRGFIMKGTEETIHGDPFNDPNTQRYDFRGRPNNGTMQLPVQVGVPFTDGIIYNYTLAGNPYPSALNLYDVFNDPDNTEIDSFKFWDEDRSVNSHLYVNNKGGYGTWLPGASDTDPGLYTAPTFLSYDNSGVPTGGSTGTGASFERLNAPVGQGFMIMADNIGDGFVYIRNSHRRYIKEGAGNNSQFRNPNGTSNSDASSTAAGGGTTNNATQIPHMRLQTFFGDNTHMRDMILAFRPESTDGYDRGMDATHPMDGDISEAYFKIGESADTYKNLVIQTVPFAGDKQVPISFALEEETKFYVTIVDETNAPYSYAYLFDSERGTYQEITNGELAVQLLPAGTYESRFFITFRGDFNDRNQDPLVDAQNELKEAVEFFQNNRVATLEVNNPEGYDVKSVNIFDMAGKLVLSQENLGTQKNMAFPTANFSDGVYLVKLTTVDNFAIDYKINVFNK
ncbi:MAG: T9SS type A sorting domain-containing protein [Bacteroidota bacterium]